MSMAAIAILGSSSELRSWTSRLGAVGCVIGSAVGISTIAPLERER